MLPRSRQWLTDMADLVERLETKRAGRSLEDYLRDDDLRDIVERNLEKIGELTIRLRDHDPATVARIDGFQKIIGLRNLISHDYESVSAERLWGFLPDVLPALAADVRNLLDDEDAPGS